MPQSTDGANVLTYATGAKSALSRRGWSVLFWLGVVHLLAVLVLAAASVPGFVRLWEFLRTGSLSHWFPIGLIMTTAAISVMALTNVLAVAGYWQAKHGRSAASWFRIYVPTQLALIVSVLGTTVAMAVHGQYQLSPSFERGQEHDRDPDHGRRFPGAGLPARAHGVPEDTAIMPRTLGPRACSELS
jgi:hypothetical protein